MSTPDAMFASSSVPRHLVRGALGLPMMVAAFVLIPWLGPLALLLLVPAVVLLRGCPTCWALGLAQTCALRPQASAVPIAVDPADTLGEAPGTLQPGSKL